MIGGKSRRMRAPRRMTFPLEIGKIRKLGNLGERANLIDGSGEYIAERARGATHLQAPPADGGFSSSFPPSAAFFCAPRPQTAWTHDVGTDPQAVSPLAMKRTGWRPVPFATSPARHRISCCCCPIQTVSAGSSGCRRSGTGTFGCACGRCVPPSPRRRA